MARWTKQAIREDVVQEEVEFLRLAFTDIHGHFKNVELPVTQLDKALENEVVFDGSSIQGFVSIEASDMALCPDLDSWTVMEEDDYTVGLLICDIHLPEGDQLFAGDPRGHLKEVVAGLEKEGFTDFNLGAEAEFFLFKLDESGRPTLQVNDEGKYFDMAPLDESESCRRAIVRQLEALDFHVEAAHHETTRGQHEINFRFDSVVQACDKLQIFKLIVKKTARDFGLHASFMPKPIYGIAGNGMHCNLSLMNEQGNAFYDPNSPVEGLSTTALHFMGGLLSHAKAITALANPIVNSYKRLVPGFEAPVYIAWSAKNRTPLIRIPASRGMGTRIELRSVDPSANPYLVMAAVIEAGLDGIHQELDPGEPTNQNLFKMTEDELQQHGIDKLPTNLNDAITALEADPVVNQALGDHISTAFIQMKREEFASYMQQVTDWEIANYFTEY